MIVRILGEGQFEVDDAATRNGVTQTQEVVERLLTFGTEPLVLIRAPPVDRRDSHCSHV